MPVEMSRAARPKLPKMHSGVESFDVRFVENGVTVRVAPKPKESDDDGTPQPWSPGKEYVFRTFTEAAEFMEKCCGAKSRDEDDE